MSAARKGGQGSTAARSSLAGFITLLFVLVPAMAFSGDFRASSLQSQAITIVPADATPVAAEYFGLHIHRAVGMTPAEPRSAWPPFTGWSWRLWDARVAWKDIERERGVFDFSRLDSICNRARTQNVRVLLTLGLTPQWASRRPLEPSNYESGNQAPPSDLEDWRRYVDTIAKRYRGRIEAYEIWNEPNIRGFFSGTPEDLVRLAAVAYRTVKRADHRAIVVTPSASGGAAGSRWLKEYLAAGGAEYADVVGFHFYVTPDDPEAMLSVIDTVRAVLVGTRLQHHPVWNTESGWLLQNHDTPVVPSGATGTFASRVLDDSTGAAFVVRALVLGRCGSLSRFYWYAWDNRRMGLTEADGIHLKVEAQAYQTARQWLRGARVTVCERTTGGVWIARISRGKGLREAIVWSTAAATSVSLADGSSVVSEWPLLGAEHRGADTRSGVSIHATGAPTLVRYR